jgi:hypothetical protein
MSVESIKRPSLRFIVWPPLFIAEYYWYDCWDCSNCQLPWMVDQDQLWVESQHARQALGQNIFMSLFQCITEELCLADKTQENFVS